MVLLWCWSTKIVGGLTKVGACTEQNLSKQRTEENEVQALDCNPGGGLAELTSLLAAVEVAEVVGSPTACC